MKAQNGSEAFKIAANLKERLNNLFEKGIISKQTLKNHKAALNNYLDGDIHTADSVEYYIKKWESKLI